MPLHSDLHIDASKFRPEAINESAHKLNDHLIQLGKEAPRWWEVGAARYRIMRRDGKTPFPKRTVIESGKDMSIPSRDVGRDIPCRFFVPENGRQPKGVFMHVHGGGWVLQSESDQDSLLKAIADGSDLAVISVGYRLSPEHSYPKPVHDCFDAAEWLVDNAQAKFGAGLKFISGESAGGHLSLLTVYHLLTAKPSFQFAGIVLHYGAFDLSFLPAARNFPKPLILDLTVMQHFCDAFLPGMTPDQRKDPAISPLYRDLAGMKLPPALFTCGTEDCLLDDTVMMAVKYHMSGAETIVRIVPGAPHGYTVFPADQVASAEEGLEVTKAFLTEKLG